MDKSSHDVENPVGRVGLPPAKSSIKRPASAALTKPARRSRAFPAPSDANRRKRVKFAGEDCEREGNLGAPSFQNEGNYSDSDDGAKTFEYKSFKKLLEKTALQQYSGNLTKNNSNMKTNKVGDYMEGFGNDITNKYDNKRSLFLMQNISSVAQGHLSSPTRTLHKPEYVNKRNGQNGIVRSVPIQEVTPTAQPLHPSSERFGDNCGDYAGSRPGHTESFSGIRQCLLKLAARTCSQNFDEFLSKRSDLILEFLGRLGFTRQSNKIDKHQNSEQMSSGAHHLPASSKRCDGIVEFYCYPQENLCTIRHDEDDNPLALIWDNNEVQDHCLPSSSKRTGRIFDFYDYSQKDSCTFRHNQDDHPLTLTWYNNEVQTQPYKYMHETIFSSKSDNSDFALNEKDASILHDPDKQASAIELSKEFECEKSSYHHLDFVRSKSHFLLNSPWDFSQVQPFPTDRTSHMGQLHNHQYINTPSVHLKGVYDVCLAKNMATIENFETEPECRTYEFHRANYNPFQSGCLIPNNSYAEIYSQKQAVIPYINDFFAVLNGSQYEDWPLVLTKEKFSLPLLKWVGTPLQELQYHLPSTRYDVMDFCNGTPSSSFTDVYGRKGFNYLQSSNLDILLQDSIHFSFEDELLMTDIEIL